MQFEVMNKTRKALKKLQYSSNGKDIVGLPTIKKSKIKVSINIDININPVYGS
jgi:hypothetical protein